MTVKYPTDHKIYQHFPFLGPSKFTQWGFLVWNQTIWQPCLNEATTP
jgi:hypothetical protein